MATLSSLTRRVRELEDRVEVLLRAINPFAYYEVPKLPPPVPIGEQKDDMGHFIQNRQVVPAVPAGLNITAQSITIYEDDVAIAGPTDIPIEGGSIEYWAEVGKSVNRKLSFTRGDGQSAVGDNVETQVDNFNAPIDPPPALPPAEQIGEVTDSPTRPA